MNLVAELLLLAGGLVALLAGVGIMRFSSPYARFHSAGKASPVAFLVAATGAAIELGFTAAALLLVAGVAMTLTLPVAVHLLFRAVHRTTDNSHLQTDDLAAAEREAG